tara:strand:+ start:90 stop:257 length:168 start_codon:yes stop_codon:yes gene_type:complete
LIAPPQATGKLEILEIMEAMGFPLLPNKFRSSVKNQFNTEHWRTWKQVQTLNNQI